MRERSDKTEPRHDAEVRPLLRERLRAVHPGALVVEELGLDYGCSRVDLAVVTDALHGYEIKAEADTLKRLRVQAEMYGHVLDYVTLVASPGHVDAAARTLPPWWGLWSIEDGGIRETRAPQRNTETSPHRVLMLMWRNEMRTAVERITRRGASRLTKPELRSILTERLTPDEIRALVCDTLRSRPVGWQTRTARFGVADAA